jgi:hypothetical protein
MSGQNLVPLKDAADRLGVHITTLYGRENAGKVKLTRRTRGNRVLVFMTEAEINKQDVKVKSDDDAQPRVKRDALDAAFDNLKKVIRDRESKIRKETIIELADSLKQEVKKES